MTTTDKNTLVCLPAFFETITQKILKEGYAINRNEAKRIASTEEEDAMLLFHFASKLRKKFRGDKVSLCSIVNAKSGACSEDCAFCAQSAHHNTAAPVYPMMTLDQILTYARQAKEDGAHAFGIVISGRGVKNHDELHALGEAFKRIKQELGLDIHASVGILNDKEIQYLKECGVTTANHNLETSKRYFKSICSTHTFDDRVETLKHLKENGLKVCSGGIFGMGETWEDRIDLAFTLRELDVSMVPMNFLYPIEGTPLMERQPMPPIEILITVALYRFIMPDKEIKICGGREKNLRDLQCMMFAAGADSMMIGNYLTTAGREPELDHQMLRDLNLSW